MKRKVALLLLTAAAVFALHAGFLIWRAERIGRQWIDIGGESPFRHYILQADYLLSLSYAIVAAFTLYSLMRARESEGRRGGCCRRLYARKSARFGWVLARWLLRLAATARVSEFVRFIFCRIYQAAGFRTHIVIGRF